MRKQKNELFTKSLPYPENFNWFAKVQKMCSTHNNSSLDATRKTRAMDDNGKVIEPLFQCDVCGYWFFADEL